jgi:hypothetical protein
MIYSTKFVWAGEDCILLSDKDTKPIAILKVYEVRELIKEWEKK